MVFVPIPRSSTCSIIRKFLSHLKSFFLSHGTSTLKMQDLCILYNYLFVVQQHLEVSFNLGAPFM